MGKAKIYVDTRSGCLAEAGDVLIPIKEELIKTENITEIGEAASKVKPSRESDDEIIVFKTVGSAVQDIVVGHEICMLCEKENLG